MKQLILIISLLFAFACSSPNDKNSESVSKPDAADNQELSTIFLEDQRDRQGIIDWSEVGKRDSIRLARVNEMVNADMLTTGQDFYRAAMIYQHGPDTISSAMAVKMMRKAVEIDNTISKWLLAAAIDRDLINRNKPQIFGTQYTRSGEYEPWKRHEIDTTKVNDKERREYGVRTLKEQRQYVISLNKEKLPELLAQGKTIAEIIEIIRKNDSEFATFDFSETAINNFAYQMMNDKGAKAALPLFELNTELYPDAWNTFDSLGECLLALDRKEDAVKAYKKSLELNPENTTAMEVISQYDS